MSKLYFCNNGEFNVTAMLTFGVSAKEGTDPFGKFGTGFKYAVAVILRGGGKIRVHSKGTDYEFSTKKETIRDKEFDVVYMNGQNAGFTTHFGINWEPWMAFRELYCNMKDEDGELIVEKGFLSRNTKKWDTYVEVEWDAMNTAYLEIDKYFLTSEPVTSSPTVEIHEGPSNVVFYQGVKVYDLGKPARYTYNFLKGIDLTEERMARYNFQINEGVSYAVQKVMGISQLRSLFSTGDCLENSDYDATVGVSSTYKTVCESLMHTQAGIPEVARRLLGELADASGEWPKFHLTNVQELAMVRAKEFLKGINVDVEEFPINTVTGLGTGVMGRAYEGQIYLSEAPFNMGVKQLASTLLEEYVHLKLGCADFDRTMQNYLFDKILSLAEEINQEVI